MEKEVHILLLKCDVLHWVNQIESKIKYDKVI